MKVLTMKPIDHLTFTVPITAQFKKMALQFSQQQSRPEKRQQVYQNTLAVLAVNFYCQCMGIETVLAASDSWDLVQQTLSDVADLHISQRGKLECRPMVNSAAVQIPLEVKSNRIGYVAVQMDDTFQAAKIVGFLPQVECEFIALDQWQSLENFLEHLEQLATAPMAGMPFVTLSQWLQNQVEIGWQQVESLLEPKYVELALSFRGAAATKNQTVWVDRGKLLNLARAGEQVALVVGLMPNQTPEMDISVEVYPTGGQTYLPQDLHLMVLDEAGIAVMQAQARSTQNIQLEFSGTLGEKFSVKVALGEFSITEAFCI